MRLLFVLIIFFVQFSREVLGEERGFPLPPAPPPFKSSFDGGFIKDTTTINIPQKKVDIEEVREFLREVERIIRYRDKIGFERLLSPNLLPERKERILKGVEDMFSQIRGEFEYDLDTEVTVDDIEVLDFSHLRVVTFQSVKARSKYGLSFGLGKTPCVFILERVEYLKGDGGIEEEGVGRFYLLNTNFYYFIQPDKALKLIGGCGAILGGGCCFFIIIVVIVIWLVVRALKSK